MAGILITSGISSFAQSLPVGTPVLDDYYRREQLLGKVDSNLSFTLRPLGKSNLKITDIFDPDSTLSNIRDGYGAKKVFANANGLFQILPLTWQQQFNSNHPYGWNDEAMIPSKGYQTMISGGIYLKIGFFSMQLRPEYVYATNSSFAGFAVPGRSDAEIKAYYNYYNNTDAPERFGYGVYSKWFWGQSNIKLTVGPMEAGVSNESLWWGPGIQNSLIMSNNAPGFKHITINTSRPIKTYIGHFEGQIIAGRLDGSNQPALLKNPQFNYIDGSISKTADWRYFTGFNINYHPKWLAGLTLGITRTFDAYEKDVHGFSGYLPFFTPYSKSATTGPEKSGTGDPFPRDQYTSFYGRWLFLKAQAELYLEYGLNDNSYNLTDFFESPDHSRAYIVGLRKMLALPGNNDQHILFGAEITQLSQSIDRIVRGAGGWYVHSQIKQGQTNLGQWLGAGTGSGGNLQSVETSWVSGLKKIGFQIDRFEHAVDFSDKSLPDINGNNRQWVDFAFALKGEWDYKNFLFNVKLQQVKSLNYEWILKDYNPGQYYIPHNTAYNFHAEMGITYRF